MKKVINGKLYNTATATLVGIYESGTPGDFSYVCERLYQKGNGELFLHGEGGPMSEYREYYSENSWGGGEEIIPAARFNVKRWVSRHCDLDTYIKLFGPVSE